MMNIEKIRARLLELSIECRNAGYKLDISPERTELFCLQDVLRKLSTPGYGIEVHDAMNPLFDDNDDGNWDG